MEKTGEETVPSFSLVVTKDFCWISSHWKVAACHFQDPNFREAPNGSWLEGKKVLCLFHGRVPQGCSLQNGYRGKIKDGGKP